MSEETSEIEDDMEINDFYYKSQSDNRRNLDNIHNAAYDIMIEFKSYVNDVSLPLIEKLDYIYLFDYIESLK